MKVARRWPRIEEGGGAALAVFFEDPERLRRGVLRDLELPFPVLLDPERRAYRDWGLGRGSFAAIYLSADAWRPYVTALVRDRRIERPGTDLRQLGGDFVVAADGRVVFSHPQTSPSDRPPVGVLVNAMEQAG